MTSALRKLCGPTKTAAFPSLWKLAAGPAQRSWNPYNPSFYATTPGAPSSPVQLASRQIGNAVNFAKGYPAAAWNTYSNTDGAFWHPSKSTEDNLRGYAEGTGEMAGGIGGAVGGGVGGTAAGGPVGGVALAVGGGYLGGKTGKGFGRNAFNWAWGSNGTQGGVDSMGRNTGFGINNGTHGNDFKPQLADAGYLLPGAGGALKVPLNQGMKPTLKPMANHLANLAGRRGAYTPVYESLPLAQRYAYGPNSKLQPYVNTAGSAAENIDPDKWYHGRRLHADTGQFSGTNKTPDGHVIPDRNLRYQVASSPREDLYRRGMDTESFLTQKGVPRDSAERMLKNKGGIGAHFGKGFAYEYPELPTPALSNAKPGWNRIEQPDFLDVRKLTDAQAAKRSLTGSQIENGKRVPVPKNDGNAPSYSGINAGTVKQELNRHPENKALSGLHDRLQQPYGATSGVPEFTVAPNKMPTQGYTKIKAPGDAGDKLHPWKMKDETPVLSPLNIMSKGIGAPYSQIGEKATFGD